ncbi:hypothetical protein [Jatrophihabitans sp.]|uniref:hypothetical protein n=1 Tax=Jatrophihabitans sp. TaxID=1932789 RepID=UPI002CDFC389|nr:hypothetical protein [Jatrophihabitans sp.]
MTELDEVIQALQRELRSEQAQPGDKDTRAGMLAGLLEAGPARVAPNPGETVYHHAGYLSGHLLRWLIVRGQVFDERLRSSATGYASSLADPGGQAMLDKPDRPMTAHSYAAVRCERASRQALPESEERMLFEWLLEVTRTPYTQERGATFQRLRAHRQDRLRSGGLS